MSNYINYIPEEENEHFFQTEAWLSNVNKFSPTAELDQKHKPYTNQHKTNHPNILRVTEVKIKAWFSNFNKVIPAAELDHSHKTLTPS